MTNRRRHLRARQKITSRSGGGAQVVSASATRGRMGACHGGHTAGGVTGRVCSTVSALVWPVWSRRSPRLVATARQRPRQRPPPHGAAGPPGALRPVPLCPAGPGLELAKASAGGHQGTPDPGRVGHCSCGRVTTRRSFLTAPYQDCCAPVSCVDRWHMCVSDRSILRVLRRCPVYVPC